MAIPASGALALSDIQTEYGGSNPIGMSEYYGDGDYVMDGLTDGDGNAVPESGAISISHFYDTSNAIYMAAQGGTVTTVGDYKYHKFTSSGQFVVTTEGNAAGSNAVEYLVVAGGGGGAGSRNGHGGNGQANTGGGAGGGRGNPVGNGGNGGSGIVILRYQFQSP